MPATLSYQFCCFDVYNDLNLENYSFCSKILDVDFKVYKMNLGDMDKISDDMGKIS